MCVLLISFKFHEVPVLLVNVLWLISWILNQFEGDTSCKTEASQTKVDVHQFLIVMYIRYKFHRILSLAT